MITIGLVFQICILKEKNTKIFIFNSNLNRVKLRFKAGIKDEPSSSIRHRKKV